VLADAGSGGVGAAWGDAEFCVGEFGGHDWGALYGGNIFFCRRTR
jgi:hypothetical protein